MLFRDEFKALAVAVVPDGIGLRVVLVDQVGAQLLLQPRGDRHERRHPVRLLVLGRRHARLVALDEGTWRRRDDRCCAGRLRCWTGLVRERDAGEARVQGSNQARAGGVRCHKSRARDGCGCRDCGDGGAAFLRGNCERGTGSKRQAKQGAGDGGTARRAGYIRNDRHNAILNDISILL